MPGEARRADSSGMNETTCPRSSPRPRNSAPLGGAPRPIPGEGRSTRRLGRLSARRPRRVAQQRLAAGARAGRVRAASASISPRWRPGSGCLPGSRRQRRCPRACTCTGSGSAPIWPGSVIRSASGSSTGRPPARCSPPGTAKRATTSRSPCRPPGPNGSRVAGESTAASCSDRLARCGIVSGSTPWTRPIPPVRWWCTASCRARPRVSTSSPPGTRRACAPRRATTRCSTGCSSPTPTCSPSSPPARPTTLRSG